MSITIVTGTAGSGKTAFARKRAAELAAAGKRAALLVPEQFSFETEKAMLQMLPADIADRVEAFSFTSLARRIAREAGGLAGKKLDRSGRAAVMNVAMKQVQDYLFLYAGNHKRQDLITNMLAAVAEFKSCGISPELLRTTSAMTGEEVLSQKLGELALIYGAYNAVIANIGSIDPMDDLSRLAENLKTIDYFSEMVVIADSFTGFTRQEQAVLKQIISQCDKFEITLCCDPKDAGEHSHRMIDLFASVYDTIDFLRDVDGKIEWQTLESGKRYHSPALKAVESGLFRTAHTDSFVERTDDVVIYAAEDKYDETEFVAREIRRLVREKGLRYRDFAIICRTESDYRNQMLRSLELQGIPCFCDRRSAVTDLPLVRFVMSSLDIVNGRWRSEDIMRWIKTGMLRDVSMVDAARLENYCFVWSITGKKWKEDFTQSPYGYAGLQNDAASEALMQINATKACIVNLLDTFEKAVKRENATGRDMAGALFQLIDSAGCAECIEAMLPKLRPQEAEAQGQIWKLLMNILDQMVEILGDSVISFREFSDMVNLMLGLCDVGEIPQGMDEVIFGSADRIRTGDIKAVFLLGANEGVFPLTPESGGVFTETERKVLISLNLPISGDPDSAAMKEQYLAYAAVTCSSEMLYLTYAKSCNGEQLYTSEIVTEISRILPECRKMSRPERLCLEMLENDEAGFLLAAASVNDHSGLSEALLHCYSERENYADRLGVVKEAVSRTSNLQGNLALHDASLSSALFGRNIRISASKAECFYNCKFKYFCQYGMKTQQMRRASLDPLEYGSVVHYVLENMLREHDIGSLASIENLSELIGQYLTKYLVEQMGGSDLKSARFIYLFKRLSQSLSVLIHQLTEEFAKSLFTPEAFELQIDGSFIKELSIPLSDGTKISVGGKIDRVDIYRKDDVKYIRVVDYKTGIKEFVLSDLLSGLNMQMLIYLDIICDQSLCDKSYSPAGVIYSPAALKKISGQRGRTSIDDEHREMLQKNGLIIDEADVINAMEIGMQKKVDKNDNAGVKGGETFRSAATYVADVRQFDTIRRYVRSLLREMGEALHRGEIGAVPVKGIYDACEYCDYRVLCTQEQKNGGRVITKKSMSETVKLMQEDSDE